jgi:hypothetical protein
VVKQTRFQRTELTPKFEDPDFIKVLELQPKAQKAGLSLLNDD